MKQIVLIHNGYALDGLLGHIEADFNETSFWYELQSSLNKSLNDDLKFGTITTTTSLPRNNFCSAKHFERVVLQTKLAIDSGAKKRRGKDFVSSNTLITEWSLNLVHAYLSQQQIADAQIFRSIDPEDEDLSESARLRWYYYRMQA